MMIMFLNKSLVYYNYKYKFPLLKKLEAPALKLGSVFPIISLSNSVSGDAFFESITNVSV